MKKVKFILVALVTMFTTTAMAQATYTDAENNKYESGRCSVHSW